MAIDVGALRKFADTFGPAVEAIPAVLDAISKQADMDRAVNAAIADVAKAKAEAQKVYDEADERIKVQNDKLTELLERQGAVVADIDKARKEAAADAKKKAEAAADKVSKLEAKAAELQAAVDSVAGVYAAKAAELKAEHEAKASAFAEEIKDLEKRKAAAEKALDALRAKLG